MRRLLLVCYFCFVRVIKRLLHYVSHIMSQMEMSNTTLDLSLPKPCVTFSLTNHTMTLLLSEVGQKERTLNSRYWEWYFGELQFLGLTSSHTIYKDVRLTF